MTCAEFSRYYTDFRDGNDLAMAQRMWAHAELCPKCRSHHRALNVGVEMLRNHELDPSEGLTHALSARFKVRPIR